MRLLPKGLWQAKPKWLCCFVSDVFPFLFLPSRASSYFTTAYPRKKEIINQRFPNLRIILDTTEKSCGA